MCPVSGMDAHTEVRGTLFPLRVLALTLMGLNEAILMQNSKCLH